MDEHWDFYLFDDQGAVASNFVNLALAERAPVPTHRVLGLVEVTMLTPRPDGLSSDSEADALNDLEDAIVNASVQAGAINCGRTTGRGVRTLAFYSQSAASFESAARGAASAFPAYACDIETKSDPEWDYYLDFLFPSEQEWERMKNKGVVQALLESGDDPSKTREIDHWSYFDDPAAARAFAEAITTEGFSLRTPVGPTEDGRSYCVQCWRTDAPDRIDEVTQGLSERARSLGGHYDGWETEVMR